MKNKVILFIVLGIFLFLQPMRAQTWSATKRLTWNNGNCWDLNIASGNDSSLHILWRDNTPGNNEIFYRKSTNNGNSWLSSKRLTWTPESSAEPRIALDSSNDPYIVWSEGIDVATDHYDIFFRKSTDGGSGWSARKRLTWNPDWSDYPRIILDHNDNIHVIWIHYVTPTNAELYHKKSTDGGNAWTAAQRLTLDPGTSDDPCMAVDSNDHIYIVWNDEKTGNYEIYLKISTDGGTSWKASKRLTWTTGSSFYPWIAIDTGDNLHVGWMDNTKGDYEIFYKKSTNGGTTWSTKRLTYNVGNSYYPKIAFGNSNNPQMVWADYSFGMCQVMYKESTNGGTSWTGAKRLTWTAVHTFLGSLTVDSSNNPHVIFRNNVPGDYEVYYKNRK